MRCYPIFNAIKDTFDLLAEFQDPVLSGAGFAPIPDVGGAVILVPFMVGMFRGGLDPSGRLYIPNFMAALRVGQKL